ncbi:hypothetical protein sscle_06g050360 [Sclerotinia sclerotiorum 1980 UF-70]|uniref:Uncharacterized protein n=1 Tax=Sclerotinia sclerotiorum (strain ATCC 18683 / 1980 / Ss-1) TaxID=665079 RepID=A0A1D9Q5V0_SCLS1|nr:hypothetical protein sscle_06g050360 [Sclerotinia sclerotiorum 1980 UF-70]
MMVDYAKYRVSDALHVSIEEVINGEVKQEIHSTAPPLQSENTISNAKHHNLYDALDTLKNIPGFTPTSAGHMMIKQENNYLSSQSQNPQPTPTTYNASQSSPHTKLDAVQFNENDFSDDDNIDLDTNYDLPMSQSSFTNSQPRAQSHPSKLPPSSLKTHTPGNLKVQIKSERRMLDSPFDSSLPDFSTSQATPQPLTSASSSSTNIKTGRPSKSSANSPYLSYYQMEQMYYTSGQDPQTDQEKLARRQWLAKLGIDISPFNFVYVGPLQRDKFEVHWALKSPEIRRDIEKKAIRLKQPYSKA